MFQLYPYQERVLAALMDHQCPRNIVLRVPTGGGKTYAACLPFFQDRAFADGLLPAKALYVVPMRVLATQFHATCELLYKEQLNPALFSQIEASYAHFGRKLIALQTGESPDDPQFESMITACTIDQMVSSALGIPYSLDGRKANINVAAIASSFLILDEPHLYPVAEGGSSYKGALTTCLELLRLLKGLTRFVFMSATMSSKLVRRLCSLLDAELIEPDTTELQELNKERSRIVKRALAPMDAAQIVQQHDRCSLVVCNTVLRAQQMYLWLAEAIESQRLDIELHLLHSRFSDEDRRRQGDELAQLLGKHQWGKDGRYLGEKNVIIVATQVVEVGLDISVQTLHSELAPANSLVQRAGRCARFERQQGCVIVYPLRREEQDTPASTLPYAADLCDATWEALVIYDGRAMGFREEQDLIDRVHTTGDLALLDRYEAHRDDLQGVITTMLQTSERGNADELIRDVNQVQLLVHDDPNTAITTRPWRWQSFGLHPSALMGKHWTRLRERQQACDLTWMCRTAEKNQVEQQDDEDDQRLPVVYTWSPITGQEQVPGALLVALPHQLVTYNRELGLVFLDGRLALPPRWQQRLEAEFYQSSPVPQRPGKESGDATHMQQYAQHIGGLADAYHYAIYHELAYTMQCLEALMGLEAGTIDHAIQLAIAIHDLGKLDATWQRWARAWQRHVYKEGQWSQPYQEPEPTYLFAKTDYDYRSREQRQWQKDLPIKRPPHACESVRIARGLVLSGLGVHTPDSPNYAVARAVCSAVAHHHTPAASKYGATKVAAGARAAIKKAFEDVRRGSHWTYDLDQLVLAFEQGDLSPTSVAPATSMLLTTPDVASGQAKLWETWLAFLIVRALRLADQRADLYLS